MLFYAITISVYVLIGYFFVLTFKHIKEGKKKNKKDRTSKTYKLQTDFKKVHQELDKYLDFYKDYNLYFIEGSSKGKLSDEVKKKIAMTYLKGGNSHLKKNKSLEELEKAKKEQDSKKLYSYSRGSALEKVIN